MKFVDAILSNNSTDDHCREFVVQKGLVPLMDILGLPNLPVDFPVTPACQVFNPTWSHLHHKFRSLVGVFVGFLKKFRLGNQNVDLKTQILTIFNKNN